MTYEKVCSNNMHV